MMTKYHNPVLLQATLSGLAVRPDGVYVDATFGGGGHAAAILEALGDRGRLFGFDQDNEAKNNIPSDPRFQFIAANFSHLKKYLKFYKASSVDGILADFGVSSHQFDTQQRGFSIRSDARLDMRMNQEQELDAFYIVNHYTAEELSTIFFRFGELKNAKRLAALIVEKRIDGPINTTFELKAVLQTMIPQRFENKVFAQLFQAIRIEVNKELEVIQEFLVQAAGVLKPNGRLVCISYHSLEDRLVKRFFQSGNFKGAVEKDFYGKPILSIQKVGKLIVPTEEEIATNSRARSAKLRIAEKI